MLLRLLLTLSALVWGLVAAGGPSGALAVPDSQCARYDHGLRTGICFRSPGGGLFWLGTFRGYDGVELYCIDYLFATDWGVAHSRVRFTAGLATSLGGRVDAATVAALTSVVTSHPASAADDTTAAAIGLLIREVMGDVRTARGWVIPGGLTATREVRDVAFVTDAVVRRADQLWDQARVDRGPWKLSATIDPGADGKVTVGERVRLVLRGRSGSGKPQDMRVELGYTGFSGPSAVTLGADGTAGVVVRARTTPGSGSIRARVEDAPSPSPLVILPRAWRPNPQPGHSFGVSQRGLIGRQALVSASASASTVVVKVRPSLQTQASSQLVEPGALIHDAVRVSGTRGAAGSFGWSLVGPIAQRPDGTCPGADDLAWEPPLVLASGRVTTQGDGVYRTPDYQVRLQDVGCLTYVESMPATATTLAVSTVPGIPSETVLVSESARKPCVTTVASRQRALVGSRLHDRIEVGCIRAGDRLVVRWYAHGPVQPRPGATGVPGCRSIPAALWKRAPVVARGSVTVSGPGRYLTAPYLVRKPGCYTFSESAAATATTTVASTAPGVTAETTLITRPAVPVVPEVPTGPYRAATPTLFPTDPGHGASAGPTLQPGHRTAPRYLRRDYVRPPTVGGRSAGTLLVPALGIGAPVQAVPLRQGVMAVPDSPRSLGWLRGSARPGDVVGSSVIAGHVSDRRDRPGALARLGRARIGTRVVWVDAQGRARRFAVTGLARYPRAGGLPASLFRTDGPHRLRLVTCARRVALPGGGFHYADNLVVTARAVR